MTNARDVLLPKIMPFVSSLQRDGSPRHGARPVHQPPPSKGTKTQKPTYQGLYMGSTSISIR